MFDLNERRAFVRHPVLDSLITSDLEDWLAEIERKLSLGEYRPEACPIVLVPKSGGHVRPGADLRLTDQVVYAALVQHTRPQIAAAIGPATDSRDYSYHLRSDASHVEWFEPFFPRWQAFDRDSVRDVDNGAAFVVVADVAGCYEHIDTTTLRSDLNAIGVDDAVLRELMECLNRWPRIQRRGIPQGHSPSDLLAKLYMRAVDLTLIAEGFEHRRWVDDFRIFCRTEAEARKAMVALTDALGRRGLVLQTGKSRILNATQARARFAEVNTLLNPIQTSVARALARGNGHEDSFLPPWILDRVLAGAGSEGAAEVLRSAFYNYFVGGEHDFNKTLFHYLLGRLTALRDSTYASETVSLLAEHPEEFDFIADYCTAVERTELLEQEFLNARDEGLLPYPYMLYQYFRWRVREDRALSGRLRVLTRQCAFDAGHPWYVRAIARAVLAKFGNAADLESLEAAYANAQSTIERAEILCCLQRMEAGRRNALYGRAAADGALPSLAVRLARGGRISWTAC